MIVTGIAFENTHRLFRSLQLLSNINPFSMLKSYFKIAWRNMIRSKGYSALNILGLATGMAVALLIGLWVYYECSYDRFLPGYQQAYQGGVRLNNNCRIETSPATSLPRAHVREKE